MVKELGIFSPKRFFSFSLSLQELLSYTYSTHESIYYSGCAMVQKHWATGNLWNTLTNFFNSVQMHLTKEISPERLCIIQETDSL